MSSFIVLVQATWLLKKISHLSRKTEHGLFNQQLPVKVNGILKLREVISIYSHLVTSQCCYNARTCSAAQTQGYLVQKLTIMYIVPEGIIGWSPGTSLRPSYTRCAFSFMGKSVAFTNSHGFSEPWQSETIMSFLYLKHSHGVIKEWLWCIFNDGR